MNFSKKLTNSQKTQGIFQKTQAFEKTQSFGGNVPQVASQKSGKKRPCFIVFAIQMVACYYIAKFDSQRNSFAHHQHTSVMSKKDFLFKTFYAYLQEPVS